MGEGRLGARFNYSSSYSGSQAALVFFLSLRGEERRGRRRRCTSTLQGLTVHEVRMSKLTRNEAPGVFVSIG